MDGACRSHPRSGKTFAIENKGYQTGNRRSTATPSIFPCSIKYSATLIACSHTIEKLTHAPGAKLVAGFTLLGRFAPCGSCYSAPNICSSLPESGPHLEKRRRFWRLLSRSHYFDPPRTTGAFSRRLEISEPSENGPRARTGFLCSRWRAASASRNRRT